MHAWVNIAELTKTKTLSGGLVARSTAGLPFLLCEGLEVAFVPPQLDVARRARVVSVKPNGSDSYLVTFDAINGIDDAEKIAGCFCLARRADLPEDALLYEQGALEGFEVVDEKFGFLGVVDHLIDNPAQSLLSIIRVSEDNPEELDESAGELLIPLVDEFLSGWDEEEGVIYVDVPEGLLDL